MIQKISTVFAIALLASCQSEPSPESQRIQKIAEGYCECTAQLANLNNQVAALAADTLAGKDLRTYFQKIQEEYDRARECSAAIIAKFGKLKEAEFQQVELGLNGKCPDLASQRDLLREMLGE